MRNFKQIADRIACANCTRILYQEAAREIAEELEKAYAEGLADARAPLAIPTPAAVLAPDS